MVAVSLFFCGPAVAESGGETCEGRSFYFDDGKTQRQAERQRQRESASISGVRMWRRFPFAKI